MSRRIQAHRGHIGEFHARDFVGQRAVEMPGVALGVTRTPLDFGGACPAAPPTASPASANMVARLAALMRGDQAGDDDEAPEWVQARAGFLHAGTLVQCRSKEK